MTDIPLGTIVRDRVTGLVGVAENRATFMFGCDRYCVQPRIGEDGKVPESIMVDAPQLEIVEGELKAMDAAGDPPKLVEMGQRVTDPITGRKGTITGRAVYLNGCARVLVTLKDGAHFWVDEKQVVGESSFLGKPKVPVAPDNNRRTGGPAPSSSKF